MSEKTHSDLKEPRRTARAGLCLALACLLLGPAIPAARACNTPVYRYAMYNWAPAPYYVFYFHRGDPLPADEKVNQMIAELAETGPAMANVRLESIDVAQDDLQPLPDELIDAWRSPAGENAEKGGPVYMVFTPLGVNLHAGKLDETAVRAMADSPLRRKIAEQLHDGCAAVLVFVPGAKPEENEKAEKTVKQVIARAEAGKIPIEAAMLDLGFAQGMPPAGPGAGDPSAGPQTDDDRLAEASRLKLGFVRVDRSDPSEKWLVDSLTAVEPDLSELADQPMIYFAYGRGRAMPPYVGKGINDENLTGEIQFLASACSCFIKDQNPGADLLMHCDWEATADAMAAKDPSMSGGPFAYDEFSPDASGNMVPSTDPNAVAAVAATTGDPPAGMGQVASAETGEDPSSQAQPARAATVSSASPASQATAQVTPAADSQPTSGSAAHRPVANASATAAENPEPSGSFATRQMWTFGIGLAVITVIVLGAGMVLVQRRAAVSG